MVKKALLIGINYVGSQNELNGCINDVLHMSNMLTQNCGYDSNNVRILTDETPVKPTRAEMEASIRWLVAGAKSGDTLFFHYSGHGSHIPDRNWDEADGRDEVLVPLDFLTASFITDDWLYDNLASKVPVGCTLYALTDCCHSGTMLDLRYSYQSMCTLKNGTVVADMPYIANDWTDRFSMSINRKRDLRGNVVLLSGCLDPQTSADAFIRGQGQGAFTYCLLECMKTNVTRTPDGRTRYRGNTRLRNVLKEVNARLDIGNFEQNSQLSVGKQTDIEGFFSP